MNYVNEIIEELKNGMMTKEEFEEMINEHIPDEICLYIKVYEFKYQKRYMLLLQDKIFKRNEYIAIFFEELVCSSLEELIDELIIYYKARK